MKRIYEFTLKEKEHAIIECMTYIKEKYDYDTCTSYTYDQEFDGDMTILENAIGWIFEKENRDESASMSFIQNRLEYLRVLFKSISVMQFSRYYSSFILNDYCIFYFNKFSETIEICFPSEFNYNFLDLPTLQHKFPTDSCDVSWYGFKNKELGFIHNTKVILYQSSYYPYLSYLDDKYKKTTSRHFELSIAVSSKNTYTEEYSISILYNNKWLKTANFSQETYKFKENLDKFLFPLLLQSDKANELGIPYRTIQEHLETDYSDAWDLYKMIEI